MAFETINLGTQPAGTGGDTARSAFEKTNRNFLAADVLSAAMSQAQFEAIRSQNNEEFAASGFVHFGKHYQEAQNYSPINQGMWTHTLQANKLIMGVADGAAFSSTAMSKTFQPVTNVAGILFNIVGLSSPQGRAEIKFPQAPDGKTTYNKSTGVITNHATVTAAFNAQAVDPTNVDVVTDRPDMWGLEAWLEEVSVTNPHIYPNGLPQSQSTTIDGIATSASARPATYYSVFDGDTGSKGKGLNYFDLSDANKKKVLANHKNNLYYLDDGRLVQWRLRQRTIAGAGNGDWAALNPASNSAYPAYVLCFSGNYRVAIQGKLDTPNSDTQNMLFWGNHPSNPSFQLGVFTASTLSESSVNKECYFLVCGTVNRLNQGAYHKSYNPLGAAKFVGDTFWYNTAVSVTSKADCFDSAKLLAGSGSIASGKSGRPDGRYFDAIYADGQGGVCRDMRYSAYGVDATDFAEADQRVKNGTYRGFDKSVFTGIREVPSATYATIYLDASRVQFNVSGALGSAIKRVVDGRIPLKFGSNFLVKENGSICEYTYVENPSHPYGGYVPFSDGLVYFYTRDGAKIADFLNGYTGKLWITYQAEYTDSVGGKYLQTEVIANNAVINSTSMLAGGWVGVKNAQNPTGSISTFTLSQTALSTPTALRSTNNGASWSTFTPTFNAANNSVTLTNEPAANIVILQYQAFAKQTEPAPNAVLSGLVPYNVFASSDYRPENGALLGESLIGKVLKNNSGVTVNNKSLLSCAIDSAGKLTSAANFDGITHQALTLGAPANNSPAFKLVSYLANINQQAVPHFAYTELRHNGTSFGDDGKQTIVDNQSTKPNDHGVTVSVGTARLREPIGWFKKKV